MPAVADYHLVSQLRGSDPELVRVEGTPYVLPKRFTAEIEPFQPHEQRGWRNLKPYETNLPTCHVTIAVEDGRPVLEELRVVRRPGGPPLDSTNARIPVAKYRLRAIEVALQKIHESGISLPDPLGATSSEWRKAT